MNSEETEVYDFLKSYGDNFVSVNEISKRLGHRKRYETDRVWARPILRRMEMDGILQSNPFGEYKLRQYKEETTTFKVALSKPGVDLGDTAIITLNDLDK